MSEPISITHPWIIVHQPGGEGGDMEVLLAGPKNADHRVFGLVISYVVRHVALYFDVPEKDVIEWVNKELDRPTTEIEGGKLH